MYLNKRHHTQDCNRCDTTCSKETAKKNLANKCVKHTLPKEGFRIAELVLTHPTSLNKALSALPFKANLQWYLK